MKVLIATSNDPENFGAAPEWFAVRLRKEFPQVEVASVISDQAIEQELTDCEVAMTASWKSEWFSMANKLRWIHSPSAGVHQFLSQELVQSMVLLTNGRDVHGPAVAEQVIGMIFALAKKIPQAVRFQQQHVWGQKTIWRKYSGPQELAGLTSGLVGLGSIGRNVARHAANLGMKVICVREHANLPKPEFVDRVLPTSQLKELLAASDYVVLAAPVTSATRRMIGTGEIAAMKATAYLINVGRGSLVDEPALIAALKQNKIAGAGLDVFEREPLPADSPFWDLDNVLITPHTAGMNARMWEHQYSLFSENLRRYLSGQPLLWGVDKSKGY
jgi:phosphoglycerate dehydrogenase-like enzyme